MCGRIRLSLNRENLSCACSYKNSHSDTFLKPQWIDEHNDGREYKPSYNIAPSEVTPVLVSNKNNVNLAINRALIPMMWGMIPPWQKSDPNHRLSTNNCRLEGIKQSSLYGQALNSGGRCVVVMEGFYEWQTTKLEKNKQPYYVYNEQDDDVQVDEPSTLIKCYNENTGWKGIQLLHMAGLYSVWKHENKIIYSYSIITMESNDQFSWLHHRVPAILNTDEQINAWLDVDNVQPNMALSYLTPNVNILWHPVSSLVNNSKYKNEDCNKRIILQSKNKQKSITSWLIKETK